VVPTGISSRANGSEITGIVAFETTNGGIDDVPGAIVILYNLHTGVMTEIEANKDGQFRFSDLDPGHYKVIAKSPNNKYVSKDNPNGSTSGIIELGEEDSKDLTLFLTEIPFSQIPTYTLEGYVYGNKSGTINQFDNETIATITLKSIDYPGYITAVKSNGNGSYSISSLRGNYELWITADDYQSHINRSFSLDVLKIENYNVTLRIHETEISGTVKFDGGTPSNVTLDIFLFDLDNDEIIHEQSTSRLFSIKA
jgi:hypothetical protein